MKKDFFDKNIIDFKGLKIKLASSEEIKSWSYGEVTKPETINYRTWRPEKDGLFCERIFGPTKDLECYCGKYKGIRFKGVICDKCGVEVVLSQVRRERMGHIDLAVPVVHIWFLKNTPSPISLLLKIPQKEIEAVVYFARYLVIDIEKKKVRQAEDNLKKGIKEEIKKLKEESLEERKKLKDQLKKEKELLAERIRNKDQLKIAQDELTVSFNQKIQQAKEKFLLERERLKNLADGLQARIKSLEIFQTLSEQEHYHLSRFKAADFFEARMGAEAILAALSKIDLKATVKVLREEMRKTTSRPKKNKLIQRIRIANGMLRAQIQPSWMVLRTLPVIPPELRPMVQLTGGRFATSDLNDLYRRVINRNNRLKRLINLGAPDIILRNEKRMLQEAVDTLIDATKAKARLTRRQTPPRSLSDLLRGKKGRFRKNLLGKRVDYSGRSVVVVGPELRLDQCGLPKEIALEMFRPFILRELMLKGLAPNIRSAKTLLDHRIPEVYDILEEVVKNKLVLLNRAPTLHKLSIQAFYPVLTDGLAIRLHPCVCSGFNADFDGDQMGVFLPLSKASQKESKDNILATKNLLKPADGVPVNVPGKEMVVGCYYGTSIRKEDIPLWQEYQKNKKWPRKIKYFASDKEAVKAYQLNKIVLRELIGVKRGKDLILTTVGRILFNQSLPKDYGFVNESITSGVIKRILADIFYSHSREEYVSLVDKVKDFGFWGMTISGLSLAIFDCGWLPEKAKIIKEANQRIEEIENAYTEGLITGEEKERSARDVWIETTDKIAALTWALLNEDSPIKIISNAGVKRVSQDQIKQISGIRGLVVDPLGRIVPLPTKSSFREGLSVFEYVAGARGSRKGLTDTALKTADAGYLTRKLVDVSHAVLIREEDCGTKEGILIEKEGERKDVFEFRIMGRVVAKDVKDKDGKIVVKKGEVIDEKKITQIRKSGVTKVLVRSPLICKTKGGLCSQCYGWDLGDHKLAAIGLPVGIIAAQSIGEPGTQLTLKTKHSGGVIGLDVTQGLPRVQELFEIRTPKFPALLSEIEGKIVLIKEEKDSLLIKVRESNSKKGTREYFVPKGARLLVNEGQLIKRGMPLTAGSINIRQLMDFRGLKEAEEYLLNEIQKVYESQGISIHDKHFETVIHEMSSKIKITASGDTSFLVGSYVEQAVFEEENKQVIKDKGRPAKGRRVLLGITQASLNTNSWLSAASFQETTNILTEAAILGKEDKLIGMKENVIIGRLIPTEPERVKI